MNVLLVNPFFDGRAEVPPLSLAAVAAGVIEDGFTVEILDLDTRAEDEGRRVLTEALERLSPRVVGVTSLSHNFAGALQVCRAAKELSPSAVTVLGGVHATVCHETLLSSHPELDMICRGEGEEAFRDICRAVYVGVSPEDVTGVSYRSGRGVVHNPPRTPAALEDNPLPAFHLLQGGGYRTWSLSSSRGCPHRCSFCSLRGLYGGRVRWEPLGKIMEELDLLRRLGARRVMFTDDNLTAKPDRVRDLCRRIAASGLGGAMEFYAQGRIDDFRRFPLMASWLSEAGFKAVYVGAESGSPAVLARYGKDLTPADIVRGVEVCVEQNLMPVVSFILFGPWDTVETVRETLRLALALFERGAEIAYTESLVPFPGTPVKEELAAEGKWLETQGVYHFKSCTGLDTDRLYDLLDLARSMSRAVYDADPLYPWRRVYHEFRLLLSLLEGEVPEPYLRWRREEADLSQGASQTRRSIDEALAALVPDTRL